MTPREFCWWAYRYHRPLFEAMAYAGQRLNAISSLVWLVRMEIESSGAPITADLGRDFVVEEMFRARDDHPRWADFIVSALAPTGVSAYRWLDKRVSPLHTSYGMMQLVPSTFGGGDK